MRNTSLFRVEPQRPPTEEDTTKRAPTLRFDCQPLSSRRAHDHPIANAVPLDILIGSGEYHTPILEMPYYMPQATLEDQEMAAQYVSAFSPIYAPQINYLVRERLSSRWEFGDHKTHILAFNIIKQDASRGTGFAAQFDLYASGLLTMRFVTHNLYATGLLTRQFVPYNPIRGSHPLRGRTLNPRPDSIEFHWGSSGYPLSVGDKDYDISAGWHQISSMYPSGGLWINPTADAMKSAVQLLGGRSRDLWDVHFTQGTLMKVRGGVFIARSQKSITVFREARTVRRSERLWLKRHR